jgi:hypothetical protein
MPALVAMAYLDTRNPKLRIWVEKGMTNQERVDIDVMPLGASVLSSLGLIRPVGRTEPPNEVVNEVIQAFLAIPNRAPIKFNNQMTMSYIPPSTYSCLFQQLRYFTRPVGIRQSVFLEALAYFEHLEELYAGSFSPPSLQPHLPLLKTLKRLQLGTTSLCWMEGCTFPKLEELVLGGIETASDNQFQCIQMPVCKSASFPQQIPSELLSAFEMPQLRNLDLHDQSTSPKRPFHYPSIKHFQLSTASLHFVDDLGLQDPLAMQPTLEVLEIQGFTFKELPGILDILMVPCKTSTFNAPDHGATTVELPRQELSVCLKLKELKLKHEWMVDLDLEPKQNLRLEGLYGLERTLDKMQRRERESLERVHELKRKLEQMQRRECELEREHEYKPAIAKGEYHRAPEVRKVLEFMRQRMENGYPLQCCHLEWGPYQIKITSELIGLLLET